MKLHFLAVLASFVIAASAQTWQAPSNCSAVPLPATTWGASGAADLTTTITLDTSGVPAVMLCPGVAYNLNVKFRSKRRYILAASQGSLASPTSPTCTNRVVSSIGANTVQQTLTLPCNATGYTYIAVASVDAALTSTTQYKLLKLPYATAPVAMCLSSACPNKDFNLKAFTDALATAQNFPSALQSLQSTFGEGLHNLGGDVVGNMAGSMGISDELQALTRALQIIGSLGSGSTTNTADPAAFLTAIQQLATLMGGSGSSTSTGLSGLLHALQTLGSAVMSPASSSTPGSTVNLPALLKSISAIGKLLNPSASTATAAGVSVQTLAVSASKVLTAIVALVPNATAGPSSISLPALIAFVQALGQLFVQMGAMGAAMSG